MQKFRLDRRELRKFGMTMGAVFLVISGVFLFRQKYTGATYSLLVSCVFFIMGLVLPGLLKSVYIPWMYFSFILGWVNTRVILIILYYLIFTPAGLLMRLFRVNSLKIKKESSSYWNKKEKIGFDPLNYERRF
jgi:Saxitoxin biosynthesis operon protein SxtJ